MNTARIDLHLHLDGSLNIRWAYEAALHQGVIEPACTFEDFYHILFEKNFASRKESFRKFELVCDILQHREDLYEASYSLVRTLRERGLIYAEIRFASQQHTKGGLTQKEALKAVIDGAEQAKRDYPGIETGIIDCLMHKGEDALCNWEQNLESIYAVKEYLGRGAAGLDLAGFENNCPFRDYAPLFQKAREFNIPYTMHAGEMGIGEHVLDALKMGANRIGHGINCIQKPEYLKAVLDSQIPLEICVSSNIKTTLDYASHPVRFLLKQGANITINSDNMIFAKTDLANEHSQLRMIGVSEEQLRQCTMNAARAAFCSEEIREKLIRQIIQKNA
ncbi:MAG: hypothetical protein IKG15_03780 [Solobacterium sp.]|nr:hypothetical protein [Solobacterium sp.]